MRRLPSRRCLLALPNIKKGINNYSFWYQFAKLSCLGRPGNQSYNQDARTEHGMGYNRAVDMLKDSLNLWGEIKRSAPRHEAGGEERV